MVHYITGLGQVWIGSRPPLNQAFNILWLKPSSTGGFWELRTFNQSKNSWDLIITASADQELLARVEALEEEQSTLSLKITNIEGSISILEEDTLKNEDILQEEGNNLDKVISQDAITKILQQLRSSIPDLNTHNTSPSSHEDIRTLIENNTQNINTNTTNIEKSVVLPTFNSAENSITFNTQGGESLEVELGTGGAGVQTFTITDFKNVKSPELYKLPAGTLFNVQVNNSTVQNGPFTGIGTSSGTGYIVLNSNPGNDNTTLVINWILQSNNYDGLYLGNATALTTSAVGITWTNSQTNDVVTISDFKDTSWTDNRKAGDFVFIKSSGQGIPNGPTDSSESDSYTGYAQIYTLAEDGNKFIKLLIQSYSGSIDEDKLFVGTLVDIGGEAALEWKEIGATIDNTLSFSKVSGGPFSKNILRIDQDSGENVGSSSVYFDKDISNKKVLLYGQYNIKFTPDSYFTGIPFNAILDLRSENLSNIELCTGLHGINASTAKPYDLFSEVRTSGSTKYLYLEFTTYDTEIVGYVEIFGANFID